MYVAGLKSAPTAEPGEQASLHGVRLVPSLRSEVVGKIHLGAGIRWRTDVRLVKRFADRHAGWPTAVGKILYLGHWVHRRRGGFSDQYSWMYLQVAGDQVGRRLGQTPGQDVGEF
ncbi:conserved hypothetical protein [Trichinella spiralis]|uniref:hypothetical protein n=1 Tax=Trichinella spiralis TaxID=6334 RepID=UPI0001EFB51A|nr:conserved hypothetical protein [Trichinella spiralis]